MRSFPRPFLTRALGLALFAFLASCASTPKGAYIRPVDGTMTSNFGPRGGAYHTGIDVAARRGTAVHAAQSGKVIFRGRQKRYGRLVIVDHGGGVQTYYAHLSRFNTREGARVKRGQRIGRVGSSGRATGHHLHFEVRMNGKPVNPAGVVPL